MCLTRLVHRYQSTNSRLSINVILVWRNLSQMTQLILRRSYTPSHVHNCSHVTMTAEHVDLSRCDSIWYSKSAVLSQFFNCGDSARGRTPPLGIFFNIRAQYRTTSYDIFVTTICCLWWYYFKRERRVERDNFDCHLNNNAWILWCSLIRVHDDCKKVVFIELIEKLNI